jgi:ABC-type ATPase involved in cell division
LKEPKGTVTDSWIYDAWGNVINRTGTTVVMATHDQSIVDTMRRRVIELDHGLIVRDQSKGVYA